MKYAREFVTNAVIGGVLVLLPLYLAALMLLKAMQSVVGLVRPLAALLPAGLPAEGILSARFARVWRRSSRDSPATSCSGA
jgi:hypothetical protein